MTVIKICGLRMVEHALVAAEAGADLIGLVFAPSRRQIEVAQAVAIRDALERIATRPLVVGLFVNSPPVVICDIVERCGLDMIQLSGDEPLNILEHLPGYRILKAIRLSGGNEEAEWLANGPHHDRMHLLVDAHVAGAYGGTGTTADWSKSATLATQRQILLAGGLTSANVSQAIQQVRPWGVDVSSGVETDGSKDSVKIHAFIAAVRASAILNQG
jgi:phosphoribosylanthranilate isomerase